MKKYAILLLAVFAVLLIASGCTPKEIRTAKIELGTVSKPKQNPDIPRVKENLKLAEQKYPDNGEIHFLWGRVYKKENNFTEMVPALEKAAQMTPSLKADGDTLRMEVWDGLVNEADQHRRNGDYEKALGKFQTATFVWEYQYEAWLFGSESAYNVQDFEEAQRMAKEAYLLVPDSLTVAKWYTDMCIVTEKFEEAESVIAKLIERDPTNPSNYINAGDVYSARQEYDKAMEYYMKAVELDETNSAVWYVIGNGYFMKKEFCKSKEAFERYLALDEGDKDSKFIYMLAYYQCGQDNADFDVLKDKLVAFTMEYPEHCEAWQLLANTYALKKMRQESLDANSKYEECTKQ